VYTKGFTLIELLFVIGIIGVLLSIVLVVSGSSAKKGRDAKRISEMRSILNVISSNDQGGGAQLGPIGAGGCTSAGSIKNCTSPADLSNFSDPVGTAVCNLVQSKPCQYTIWGAGGSQPTTANFNICVWLEVGSNNFGPGWINVRSNSYTVTAGCTGQNF
jgi:prepilin-type N-terminal cleavage/methylation domain-containing protein